MLPSIVLLGSVHGIAAQDAPRSWGAPRDPTSSEQAEIRGVIDRQLEAFRKGDTAAAYQASSATVHRRFSDAAGFMAMARSAYTPLMDPAGRQFGTAKGSAATATHSETFTQSVDIVDAQGGVVTAVYGLERGTDGRLTIDSCVLIPRRAGSS